MVTNTKSGELTGGKPLVKSKSFWGTLLMMVPLADIAAGAAGFPGAVSATISIVTGAAGSLMSLWGIGSREKKITSVV